MSISHALARVPAPGLRHGYGLQRASGERLDRDPLARQGRLRGNDPAELADRGHALPHSPGGSAVAGTHRTRPARLATEIRT
ncbi:hypothetical protein [Streptomyces sp. NPDC020965]|uniref:hypothetical protein n=1 Tax=Streptomyces sp. NPDC020965 TaxID=3365105 RepID=UPI00379441AD